MLRSNASNLCPKQKVCERFSIPQKFNILRGRRGINNKRNFLKY
jgi:hypothetical protein